MLQCDHPSSLLSLSQLATPSLRGKSLVAVESSSQHSHWLRGPTWSRETTDTNSIRADSLCELCLQFDGDVQLSLTEHEQRWLLSKMHKHNCIKMWFSTAALDMLLQF